MTKFIADPAHFRLIHASASRQPFALRSMPAVTLACFVGLSMPMPTASLERTALAAPQWATFVNETASRMPTGAGLNDPAVSTADPEEKDYAWGDLDNDGDIDLVCVRKVPFTVPGGKRNVLFMNENGVLIDRTATKANTALGVPAPHTSQGMLDLTNDRDVVIVDVNNDGWLDVVTAPTISDNLPRYIGHPRIYMNMGEVAGVWQGLRYEFARFPQLLSKPPNNIPWNPRFCSVDAGDVTGDGYADLYFGDYDAGSFDGGEDPIHDMDNKLLINAGASNPGFFADESIARMGSMHTYDIGSRNYLFTTFGAASVIADMNGDGINDVVKQTSLQNPIHVAVLTNPPSNVGVFAPPAANPSMQVYKEVYNGAAYFVSAGDLNNDGRLDLVMTDDGQDRYLLNTGNAADGTPNFTSFAFQYQSGGDDGFGGQSAIADLNNDGFKDVLISDVDVDDDICCRRLHIYRNLGNLPNVTLREESPSIIPTNMLTSTHNVAPIDINNDGWIDLVIGRLNSTEVWMNAGLEMSLPSGTPALVNPSTGTAFSVQILPRGGGTIVRGSARLYVSVNGGAFSFTPLTSAGGNMYTAQLPPGPCGDSLRFYVSAEFTSTGGTQTNLRTLPNGAPTATFTAMRAQDVSIELDETFEGSVAQWSVNNITLLTGAWQAADPVGTFFNGQPAAPEDDTTPAPGVRAFITENGNPGGNVGASDVDGTAGNAGTTQLISPLIDGTIAASVTISYNYWFFSSVDSNDSFVVAISNNNGGSWTTVSTQTTSSNGWKPASFRISDVITPTSQMRVRFSVTDGLLNNMGSIVEGGLDDFRISTLVCAAPCPADTNGSGGVDVDDLIAVILGWGPCPTPPAACPADTNDSGAVDVDDLIAVILAWGPCP